MKSGLPELLNKAERHLQLWAAKCMLERRQQSNVILMS